MRGKKVKQLRRKTQTVLNCIDPKIRADIKSASRHMRRGYTLGKIKLKDFDAWMKVLTVETKEQEEGNVNSAGC